MSATETHAPAPVRDEYEPRMRYQPPSVARGGFQAFVYRILEVVAQAALVIITARLMEPSGRGLYALASLTATLCSLPLGSVWSASAIEVSKKREPLPELLGGLMVIALVGGALIALVGFGVAATLGDRWWVVAFPAACAPFILYARYQEGLYQAVGHIRAVNVVTLVRVVLPLLFVAPPLIAGTSVRTAIEIWTLWLVLMPIIMWQPLWSIMGGARLPRGDGLYRRLIGTGGRLAIANTALMVSPRIGLIALAIFSGDAVVGVYSIAIAAGDVLYLMTYAIVSSAFRGIASRARAESVALTARSVRHAVLLAAACGLIVVPGAYLALPFVVGSGYGDAPTVLAILLPGIVGLSGFWALHTFFTVQMGSPAIVTRIAIITMGVNVVINGALVPPFGIWGAAIATTIANVISAILSFSRFRAESGTPVRDLLPGRSEVRDYVTLIGSLLRDRSRPATSG